MSIWTNWDPLLEVVVGDCHHFVPGSWNITGDAKTLLNQIFKETKEDLDNLATLLTSLGVKVHRPKLLDLPKDIQFPTFNVLTATNPIVPRDQYLAYGDTIYQTYTSMPDRYIDSYHYYDIFLDLYKQGYNWLSQPPPLLSNFEKNYKWYVEGVDIYANNYKDKILWHGATLFKCGDALITTTPGLGHS